MSGIIKGRNIIPVAGKSNRSQFSRAIKALLGFLVLVFSAQFFAVPVQAATYSFMNIPFVWDAPSGTATTVMWSGLCTNYPGGDDDYSLVNFPSGFTFNFAGTAYSQVRIMSNGMIQFGAADQGIHRDYTPVTLPAPASSVTKVGCSNVAPTNLLLLYWLDINTYPNISGAPVQYELLGTAPNRRFVITYNNVALYGNTAIRYTFQVVLLENTAGVDGNFEYRYTSGSSTGTGATVGVQVGSADYTLYSYNSAFIDTTNGTNVLWYPQSTPVTAGAIYHFDEASWNGTAGQVIDSSGNSQNGTSVGSANTVATTKCGTGRSGSFPTNTSNATITAVATPITPGNTGSIDFWFYSNAKWSTGPAAMLFDATTLASRPFYLMKTATGALQFDVTDTAGTIRTTTSATQTFAANTWQHVGVSWNLLPGTNQTYVQIFLNGALLTSARYTTNGTLASVGTLHVGDNRTSGVTPSGGSGNSANGLIDEVKVYSTQINAYQASADIVCITGPDHIEIDHTGSALTCSPQTVTIKACADAACSMLYTAGGVNVTLTPGGLTFAIGTSGINNAATVQQSAAGAATLAATSAPAALNATTCLNTVTATASCAMTFYNSGFLVTVPNHVSCTNATATIEAVQAAPGTGRCVPAYQNVTRAVNLYTSYTNPATGTQTVTASTGAVSAAAPGTAPNLAFDATGKATITLSYPDAGQLTLTVTDTAPTGAAMTGSGTFIAAPASFAFSAVTAPPIKAGNPFSSTITALTATGAGTACAAALSTPNFGKETAPEGVTLIHTKYQPTGISSSSGSLTSSIGVFNAGAATATLAWSEVGTIDLTATLTSGNYLGSVLTATGTTGTTGAVGRFIPDHFDTTITNGCMGCGFTYSGQPFTVYVTAKNGLATPTTTVNYDGSASTSPNFAKAVTLSAWDAATGATQNPGPGTLLPPSNTAVALTAFSQGMASLNTAGTMLFYTFTTAPTIPTIIRVRAVDTDTVTSLRVPLLSSTEGQPEIRSGRIRIVNAYGSELLQLPIAVTAQYWNASSNYVTSTTDSSSSFVVVTPPATSAVNFSNTAVSVVGSPKTVTFLSGIGGFSLLATPKVAASVDMSIPALTGASCYVVPIPVGCYLPSNTARATFGVYKGSNNFIYQRENY